MKVNRSELVAKLDSVFSGVGNSDEIEQSSQFSFHEGHVSTFNGEIFCTVPVDLQLEGNVPATQFMVILKKMTEEFVDMDVKEGELMIVGSRRKAGIRLNQDVSPLDGVGDVVESWKKLPESFRKMLDMVCRCVGHNQSQYLLTCVHMGDGYMESCDNFQMIRCNVDLKIKSDVFLRGDTASAISDVPVVGFAITDSWVHFKGPKGLRISCRRHVLTDTDAQYPSLDGFLSVEGPEAVLPEGIGGIVDRATVFNEGGKSSLVQVEFRKGKAKVTSRSDVGWYSEVGDVEYSGEEVSFSIDPKLLLEIQKRSKRCIVTPSRLAVRTDDYTYVTACSSLDAKED